MKEKKANISNLEDLLTNESFINWALNPNEETDHYWKSWISSHPQRRIHIQQALKLVRSIRYMHEQKMSPEVYNQTMMKIIEHKNGRKQRTIKKAIDWKNWVRYAASLILIGSIGFYILGPQTETAQEISNPVQLSKTTELGQMRTITLRDGSKVKLNSGSELIYEQSFSDSVRLVTLNGEGFFEIEKDPNRPFVIKTGEIETKVLGTSFNVRSYPGENNIAISVLTGKVKVTDIRGESVTLTPKLEAVYDKKMKIIEIKSFDFNTVLGWREGILLFQEEDIENVFFKIERWFGVEFVVNSGVRLEGKYNGRFKKPSIKEVMDGVALASGFNYKIKDKNKIIIYME